MHYASDIRIRQPDENVDRTANIYMNNPLRFRGETFYQSNYRKLPNGQELSGVQVVANDGWMTPYVSCMLVGIGLLAHFGVVLVRFMRRAR